MRCENHRFPSLVKTIELGAKTIASPYIGMASDEVNLKGGGDDQTIHFKRVIYTATRYT